MICALDLLEKVEYGGMSEHAHSTLKVIVEQQRLLDYPDLTSDKYFERFASYQVLKHRRFNPDPDEVEAGIMGGDGDAGVDGFYVYCNRKLIREDSDIALFQGQRVDIQLIIIQAKNKNAFEESVGEKFKSFVENALITDSPTEAAKVLYSVELLEVVSRFRKLFRDMLTMRPSLTATFYHVAHADLVDPKVKTRGDLLCSTFKAGFASAQCVYECVTGTKLIEMFYEQEETQISLPVSKQFDYQSFSREAYIGVARIVDFYEAISSDGQLSESLFEANVRDHQPDATVNQGIRETLLNPENDDFWWLNNGITILSTHAIHSSGKLQITDPLIVNGLQTSHEIFRHFKNGGDRADTRAIMVKVIINDQIETSDRIIRATNSQTKINSIFLHSTEQIHREIESALKVFDLYYDRRKNYHRNRNVSASKIITIPYLVQAVAAIVLQQPDDARVRPGTVAAKSYSKLFPKDGPISIYPVCIKLMRRCYSFLQGKGLQKTDTLNLVFLLAMYVTCSWCGSVKPRRKTISEINVDAITDGVFEKCFVWINDEFKRLGGNDRVAKGSELTINLKAHIIDEIGRKANDRKRAVR